MAYNLSDFLVIGISSRALFDLEQEDRIFRVDGLQAFIDYQRSHEDDLLRPGSAFALIRGLLRLNDSGHGRKVEVVLLSRNHPDVCLRVFNSIEHYGLDISRAALTGGAPLDRYLAPFKAGLFLSQSAEDVQSAANKGVAAGLIYPAPPDLVDGAGQIRIAFDGDCVIFSNEAQSVFDKLGLDAFYRYEKENAKKELPEGPFAKFLRTLSQIQGSEPGKSPIRVALVTDRNKPAHKRVLLTLRAWNVRIDEALFLGGAEKTEFLRAFGAHMFFDDKEEYCKQAAEYVPTGRVLLPATPSIDPEIKVTVKLDAGGDKQHLESFLVSCKGYLKRHYPADDTELRDWFERQLGEWPIPERSAFLAELDESVAMTPIGHDRRAVAPADSGTAKLASFLEGLAAKHRPRPGM